MENIYCKRPKEILCKETRCTRRCYYFAPKYNTTDEILREFETGATRDTDKDKFDYRGFFSSIVLRRYAQYMHKHRIQSDGAERTADNWKKLFGDAHYDVCLSSLWRHLMDVYLHHENFRSLAKEDVEDALCAIIFNASAYLYKVLLDQFDTKKGDLLF